MEIPKGFRFSPKDGELVGYYLKNKVMGQLPPYKMIIEKDIYGEESPWDLFNNNDPWVEMPGDKTNLMIMYTFTTLKIMGKKTGKKTAKKTEKINKARKAGCGTWHGNTGPHDIIDKESGLVIGKREMFSFKSNKQSLRGTMGHWYMHEYALTGSSLDTIEGIPSCVLCKIIRDDSKFLQISKPPEPQKNKKTMKNSAHVSDQEAKDYVANTVMTTDGNFLEGSCSTVYQPDQYNGNDDFLDVFAEDIEEMLIDEDAVSDRQRELEAICRGDGEQLYQGASEGLTMNDLDFEHASKRMRCDSI